MKKENEIPIGTRVKLSPNSKYYDPSGKDDGNPTDCGGVIDSFCNGEHGVQWDNGIHNGCYTIKCLIILNQEFYY